MGMNRQTLEIRIDELVLDAVMSPSRLSGQVAAAVSAALADVGLPPATAACTSAAVGRETARAITGVRTQ